LWRFGISSGDRLTAGEKTAVHQFMDAGGGVLHTGDHASLGQGIAGAIKRVGKMRQYPAPNAISPEWNNTLREGATPGFQFVDQSDDVPQPTRLRHYPVWTSYPWWFYRSQPHPILCGKNGPIDVFPDHQHEGEAVAPTSYPAAEWPSSSGFQPKVDVIAWGPVISPDANPGREIGLVSVYDGHRADVGRVVADSTWHHWFDINLDGFPGSTSGQAHLDQILCYFLNCAVWLAPAKRQRAMRNAMVWGSIWRHPFVDMAPYKHVRILGASAFDVFGRYAPQCLMRSWLIDLLSPRLLEKLELQRPVPRPFPIPFEEVALGAALEPLVRWVQSSGGVSPRGPELHRVEEAFESAAARALQILQEDHRELGKLLQTTRSTRRSRKPTRKKTGRRKAASKRKATRRRK
jgi:hypothetical protein